MKRVYITLLERKDRPDDTLADIGEVVVVNWDNKSVWKKIQADFPVRVVQTGRSRGASGIAWHEDKLYVACRQSLVVFDPYDDYKELKIVSVGEPTGIHQIKSHGEYLYVLCTGGDLYKTLKNDEIVNVVCARGGDGSGPIGSKGDNGYRDTLHFNSIGWDSKGHEYHLYMNQRKIVNYTTGKDFKSGLGSMPHDLCFIDDNKLLHTNSSRGELVLFDSETEAYSTVFKKPTGSKGEGYQISGFMRGVGYSKELNSVFVCTGPGTIYELDADTWEEKNSVSFETTDVGSCIYDILFDPRDWKN